MIDKENSFRLCRALPSDSLCHGYFFKRNDESCKSSQVCGTVQGSELIELDPMRSVTCSLQAGGRTQNDIGRTRDPAGGGQVHICCAGFMVLFPVREALIM